MRALILLCAFLSSYSLFSQVQTGKASFYADKFEGRQTASGEKYSHHQLTAAHKTLPFGTSVKVTNLRNDKSVVVRINDRGPFVAGRIIDLSRSAAQSLGFIHRGVANVAIEVVVDEASQSPTVATSDTKSTGKEFYNFQIERIQPEGFGIQLASFQDPGNLIHLSENLQKSYGEQITVGSRIINGVKVYSVIIGPFKSRDKAEDFKNKIETKYPDSFIVDFSEL